MMASDRLEPDVMPRSPRAHLWTEYWMRDNEIAEQPKGMTREELLALPAAVDLDTGNRALGLGRSKGYELAKRGQYPCKVLRLGKAYRVVTADLLNLLGLAA